MLTDISLLRFAGLYSLQLFANCLQSRCDLSFMPTVYGLVVFDIDTQIVLGRDSVLAIVSVFIAFAVPQLVRARIVCVFQMLGHWQNSTVLDVVFSLTDSHRRGV